MVSQRSFVCNQNACISKKPRKDGFASKLNMNLYQLKLPNWSTKLFSLSDIRNNNIKACLHETKRAAGQNKPLQIKTRHHDIYSCKKKCCNTRMIKIDVQYKNNHKESLFLLFISILRNGSTIPSNSVSS